MFEFFIIFILVWWIIFFMVLPFKNAPSEKIIDGHAKSAPHNPRIFIKISITTAIAIIVSLIIKFALNINADLINKFLLNN